MKKVFPFMLMLLAAMFTACSSDDNDTFTVSFENAEYNLTNGSVTVKITAQNAPETATDVAVNFGGTAKMDEDYTVSAKKYTVGGTSAVTEITVTAKNNFTEAKTITMSLSGVATGKNATATINLGVRDKMLYSFAQKAYVMGNEVEVELDLLNIKDGTSLVAENDIEVTIAADAASTAVEGTNYEFESKTATIAKGSSKCTFKLKTLTLDTEKSTIVLAPQVSESEGFVAGSFPTATVTMVGSYASDLLGTWVMKEMVTTKEYTKESWFATDDDVANWPSFNASDEFTFSGDGSATGYKLTTNLQSELKNYFNASSDFSFDKEYSELHAGGYMGKTTVQMLLLKNVNRYFSATETSEDTEALLGVKNITDEETGETLLDVYIIDYNSTSFMPAFTEYECYYKTKPTATMSGVYINFILKKKK